MKTAPQALILTLCLFICAKLYANITVNTSTGYLSHSTPYETTPTVTKSPNGYIVDYTIPSVTVSNLSIPPILSQTFFIPHGYKANVKLIDETHSQVDQSFNSFVYTVQDNNQPVISYSSNCMAELKPYTYRKNRYIPVNICPITYDSTTNLYSVYSHIRYEICFTPISNRQMLAPRHQGEVFDTISIVRPPFTIDTTQGNLTYRKSSAGYLIITTPQLKPLMEKFALWKKIFGYNTEIATSSVWTPQSIKDTVQTHYDRDENLLYLLLVGDNTEVPGYRKFFKGFESNPAHYYLTDYPYACMDGEDDDMADLYRGRWATSDASEIQAIIDKCIWYEEQPTLAPDFYRSGAHCAYFEHVTQQNHRIGSENKRFVQTSEDIRKYMSEYCFVDVKTSYWQVATDNGFFEPSNWNNGPTIPEESIALIKEDKSFSNLIENINEGVFYTLYRGHGAQDKLLSNHADKEDLTLNKVRNLRNGDYLPLFMSITCSSGDFSNRCFAQELLGNESGGSICTYAASETGYMLYDDFLTTSIFNYIWPDPGFTPDSTLNTTKLFDSPTIPFFGKIIDEALMKLKVYNSDDMVNEYTKEIFHCFGDPSLIFRNTLPTPFETQLICPLPNAIDINLGKESAYMSFYNHKTGAIDRYYGSNFLYRTDSIADISFSVYAPGKIPFVVRSANYTENDDIANNRANRIEYIQVESGGVVSVGYQLDDFTTNAQIVAVDLFNNRTIASIKCNEQSGMVGLHIGTQSGVYVITLLINGVPYDYKRILIPNAF